MLKTKILFSGAMLVACMAYGQKAQEVTPASTETLSLSDAIKNHGFPVVKGSTAKDKMEYRAAKKAWVSQNPELYKKLNKAPEPAAKPALMDEKTYRQSINNQPETTK